MLIWGFLLHKSCDAVMSQVQFFTSCISPFFPGELHLGSGQLEELCIVQRRHSKLA